MQVLKFGGSSVANAENINKVAQVVKDKIKNGKTIVVVSALGGITDTLLQCSKLASEGSEAYKDKLHEAEQRHLQAVKELLPITQQSGVLSFVKKMCNEMEDICNGIFLLGELSAQTKDRIVSYGELLSSYIIGTKLKVETGECEWLDSRNLIVTNSDFGHAAVDFTSTNHKIAEHFLFDKGPLFIAPGFISADTNGTTTTLGRGGSDYTAAIFAGALNASVLEIWTDVSGMMTADPRLVTNAKIIPQISYQEAMELSHFGAKVIYPPTIQPVMSKGIPVWVKNTFAPNDPGTVIQKEASQNGTSIRGISSINKIALISLEGSGMIGIPGFSKRLFEALASEKINVILISQGSSERNISAVISLQDVKKAINVLHEEFFETTYKELNLFIAGVGNVGGRLVEQIRKQKEYLLKNLRLKINVIGLANSKSMLINEDGIDLNKWKELLEKNGKPMTMKGYIDTIQSINLRNSVFADVTANEEVAGSYDQLLQKSISVVACNKIACSSSYEYYRKLKDLSGEFNAQFLYETNVGASLPIIVSLNDLLRSGDKVRKMEAVLSGTLNFVFNNYDGTRSFAEVVKQAKAEGYTEPDPRLDLSGKDVMRKIMILAREAGDTIEMEDIANKSFMPAECMTGSVDDFFKCMEKKEAHFKAIYDEAAKAGSKLKFVAKYENGKASVGLQHITPEHDLFHLYGKDNIVLFYTDRYVDQPLVIKGAGAGAEVTASGVFADIIRASRV